MSFRRLGNILHHLEHFPERADIFARPSPSAHRAQEDPDSTKHSAFLCGGAAAAERDGWLVAGIE